MLAVENIDLHYGAAQALRGVSLQAEIGRITCVLGRNMPSPADSILRFREADASLNQRHQCALFP